MVEILPFVVVLKLILVHGVDGEEVQFNPEEVSWIRKPQAGPGAEGHFAGNPKCIITMGNGKFISTIETCAEVISKIYNALEGDKDEQRN